MEMENEKDRSVWIASLDVAASLSGFAMYLYILFSTDWFHDTSASCSEGLYHMSCSGTITTLTGLSNAQKFAQGAIPTAMGLCALALAAAVAHVVDEKDHWLKITTRMALCLVEALLGGLAIGLLREHHDDALDGGTMDFDHAYWVAIAAVSLSGLRCLVQVYAMMYNKIGYSSL